MSADDHTLTPQQFANGKRLARWLVARWELSVVSARFDQVEADLDRRTAEYDRARAQFDAQVRAVEAELKAGRGLIRNTRLMWKLSSREEDEFDPWWSGLAHERDRLGEWAREYNTQLAALTAEQQTLADLWQRTIEVPTARPDNAYRAVAEYGMADPAPVPVPQYAAPVYDYPTSAPRQPQPQAAPQNFGADYGEPDYEQYAAQAEYEDYDEPEQYASQPQAEQFAPQPEQPQPTAATPPPSAGSSLNDLF